MNKEEPDGQILDGDDLDISVNPVGAQLGVENPGKPIKLTDVKLAGFSAESVRGPGTVKVWTRLMLSSDEPIFHKIAVNFSAEITRLAREVGEHVNLSGANHVLVVIRPDLTAELWVDTVAVSIIALAKKEIQAGSPVFESDIADVTELRFPCVHIGSKDKVIFLFRQDWRFGLFFDFNPDGKLGLDEMARVLGSLYRNLRYRHLYDRIADKVVFDRLVNAGWFPFVEIIGHEFDALASACEADFPLDEAEEKLLQTFDDERLDRMFKRWTARPHFKVKEKILVSAINAYKKKDPVAVSKIILTEIEGILAEAHLAATGKPAKLKALLMFAKEAAEQKSGATDTLLFPTAFAEYLESYTFADFDRSKQNGTAGSRHAVGHGAAASDSYTQVRALQALLTLDQLAFYT